MKATIVLYYLLLVLPTLYLLLERDREEVELYRQGKLGVKEKPRPDNVVHIDYCTPVSLYMPFVTSSGAEGWTPTGSCSRRRRCPPSWCWSASAASSSDRSASPSGRRRKRPPRNLSRRLPCSMFGCIRRRRRHQNPCSRPLLLLVFLLLLLLLVLVFLLFPSSTFPIPPRRRETGRCWVRWRGAGRASLRGT